MQIDYFFPATHIRTKSLHTCILLSVAHSEASMLKNIFLLANVCNSHNPVGFSFSVCFDRFVEGSYRLANIKLQTFDNVA